MTEISSALGIPGTGGGDTAASTQKLGETFDNFLTLLTTQLKYQDPLSPMDSNQFTEQLVHFTNVEQSIAQTEKLDQLLSAAGFNQTAQAVGFIGKEVEVLGEFIELSGGAGSIRYALDRNAAETRIGIVDADGNLVRSVTGAVQAGAHEFAWDGLDDNGNPLPDGLYAVFISANDLENKTVEVAALSSATVKAVRSENGTTYLDLGGAEVTLEEVLSIRQGETATPTN